MRRIERGDSRLGLLDAPLRSTHTMRHARSTPRSKVEFERGVINDVQAYRLIRAVGSRPWVRSASNTTHQALYCGIAWQLTSGMARIAIVGRGHSLLVKTGEFERQTICSPLWIFGANPHTATSLRTRRVADRDDAALVHIETWNQLRLCLRAPQDAWSECTLIAGTESDIRTVKSTLTSSDGADLTSIVADAELVVHLMKGHDLGTTDAVLVCCDTDIDHHVRIVEAGVKRQVDLVERCLHLAKTSGQRSDCLRWFRGDDLA